MKKILALVVAAAMGLFSVALAVETTAIPVPTAMTTKVAPARTTHHKKQYKAAPAQKVQAAKKYHKNTKAEQKAPKRKAQAAKRHAGKHSYRQLVKSAAQPVAQVFNGNAGAPSRA